MNEQKWNACTAVSSLGLYTRRKISYRKQTLFCCACLYQLLPFTTDENLHEMVRLAELSADSPDYGKRIKKVRDKVHKSSEADWRKHLKFAVLYAGDLTRHHRRGNKAEHCMSEISNISWRYSYTTPIKLKSRDRASIFKDIVQYPGIVKPVPTWRTKEILDVATAIYNDKDFTALPVLADAVEEAGCDMSDSYNVHLLEHLRNNQLHYRGCWALDYVLGRD